MQVGATINLPEMFTLSVEKPTKGSMFNKVRSSKLAPRTNLWIRHA